MSLLNVETTRFGNIEVEQDRVIRFVEPILGFDNSLQYVLLDHAEDSPFKWLQSVEEPELAFVVTNPKLFGIEYEFEIAEEQVKKVDIKSAEDVIVLTIVNIPQGDPNSMTANLLGPVIIGQESRKAMQVVLNDSQFSTKTPLLEKIKELEQAQGNQAEETTASSTGE